MGVATTDTAKKLLPSDALQHLQSSKFTLGSPLERMNAVVEAVLVKPSFGFNIGHNVAVFMRNYFLGHDGTITSFVRALKVDSNAAEIYFVNMSHDIYLIGFMHT